MLDLFRQIIGLVTCFAIFSKLTIRILGQRFQYKMVNSIQHSMWCVENKSRIKFVPWSSSVQSLYTHVKTVNPIIHRFCILKTLGLSGFIKQFSVLLFKWQLRSCVFVLVNRIVYIPNNTKLSNVLFKDSHMMAKSKKHTTQKASRQPKECSQPQSARQTSGERLILPGTLGSHYQKQLFRCLLFRVQKWRQLLCWKHHFPTLNILWLLNSNRHFAFCLPPLFWTLIVALW